MNKTLYLSWLEAKNIEAVARQRRVEIEEEIYKALDGKSVKNDDGFKITISQSVSRKIDAEKAREVAAELGNEKLLGTIFSWEPKLIKKEYDALDKTMKDKFALAITEKMNKPTFKVEEIKEK